MNRLSLVIGLFLGAWQIMSQTTVSGIVQDESGNPLVGTSILVKGTVVGTVTDIDGRYELEVPSGGQWLVISYTGFGTREIEIGSRTEIDIVLETNPSTLDEVIVTGFGTSSRRKLTTSVVSIDEEVYDGAAKTNPLQALQGRTPGVNIIQASGATSSAMAVRVRGQTSINASNQPLVVIDGVITDTYTGWHFVGPGASNLIAVDPNDIASIEILKDGAAAAIYGARGANGVILITTKQGKFNMKPLVSLSYQAGISEPSVRPEMMTGPEYAEAWNRAAEAVDAMPGDFYSNPENEPSTDWYDVLTRTAYFHDAHASVSGGSQTTNYHIGGGYRKEEDYFVTKGLERYSLQIRVNQLIGDKWRAGLSMSPARTINNRFWEGFFLSNTPTIASQWFPPNVEPFNENGDPILFFSNKGYNLNWSPYTDLVDRRNPEELAQFRMGANLEFSPFPNLQLKTEFNAELSHYTFRDVQGFRTRFGRPDGRVQAESQLDQNYNWTNTATWTWQPRNSDELILLLGNQIQWQSWQWQLVRGAGFPDERLTDLASAGQIIGGNSYGEEYKFAGFFTRANYSLRNKYFFSASARIDGSSRFGANKRLGFFPALSAGWMISEEPFFNVPSMTFLKISASAGQTGNAEIANFANRALLEFVDSYSGVAGSRIWQLGNNDLTWEETTQYDVSVNFGLWQERLEGTFSWYLKNTDGLLFDVPVPATNGVVSLLQNVGGIRNYGWEFELRSTWYPTSDLTIKLGVNGAFNHNEVTSLPDSDGDGEPDDIINRTFILREGESVSSQYLVRYAGVDPSNGDALFYDLEGNTIPKTSSLTNRVIAGHGVPDFTGGISLDVDFKGFFLSSVLQTALGHHIYGDRLSIEDGFLSSWNKTRRQLRSWTPENTVTDVPEARLYTDNGNLQESTRWLEKGDYLRLKNLQVGHRFTLGQTQLLTIYFSGQNLFLITGAEDIDPEVSHTNVNRPWGAVNSFSVALPRTYSIGLKLEL